MPLPPLQPISNSHFYQSGDITIHASAAIAPGAILKADPDSRIIINAGVCIGMGAILHAHEGTIEVETGAILGAGVLVVGKGKIGANACVGAAATILNGSVAPEQVVPSGSLLGDTSRHISQPQETASPSEESLNGRVSTPPPEATTSSSGDLPPEEPSISPTSDVTTSSSGDRPPEEPSISPTSDATITPPTPESPGSLSVPVYGPANLNRLLGTLFPHNQSFKPTQQEDQS